MNRCQLIVLMAVLWQGSAAAASNPVRIGMIEQSVISYQVNTFGILAPNIEDLSFQIDGRIEKFLVEEGDLVQRGQDLVLLETKDARDQLSKMKVNLAQASRKLGRIRKLHEDGSIQQSQLEDSLDEYEQVKIAYEQAELNLERCRLVAPSDGVILQEYIDSRTTIASGMPVFSFQSADESWMTEVGLIDKQAFTFKEGSRAEIRFAPYPGKIFRGNITRLAILANKSNGLFSTEITILADDYILRPGMIAEVSLYQDSEETYSVVPLDSLVNLRDSKASVFLLGENNKVHKKLITVKAISGDRVYVLEPLSMYESIVIRGQSGLSDGAPVVVVENTLPGIAGGDD